MAEVSIQDVVQELQQTPDGRTQLELATQRAVISAQSQEIERLLQEEKEDSPSEG